MDGVFEDGRCVLYGFDITLGDGYSWVIPIATIGSSTKNE